MGEVVLLKNKNSPIVRSIIAAIMTRMTTAKPGGGRRKTGPRISRNVNRPDPLSIMTIVRSRIGSLDCIRFLFSAVVAVVVVVVIYAAYVGYATKHGHRESH